MGGWEAASSRAAGHEEPNELPSGVVPPRGDELIVVEHFDPTMVDAPPSGAILCVRPLSRVDAMELAREYNPPVVISDRIQADVEKELGLSQHVRPRVGPVTKLLVRTRISWNDVRYHLVSYERDR